MTSTETPVGLPADLVAEPPESEAVRDTTPINEACVGSSDRSRLPALVDEPSLLRGRSGCESRKRTSATAPRH